MRRRAVVGFVAVFAAGVIGLLATGLTRGSELVYSLGAAPSGAAVNIPAGSVACQGPIGVPDGAAFDRVAFTLGTYFKPGPEIEVEVREAAGGRRLGGGTLPGGYPDIAEAPRHVVTVGRIATRTALEVCLRNAGTRPVAVYGQPAIASPRTFATLDGQKLAKDMAITLNGEKRSVIAQLPTMADRASLFRAGWVSPLTYLVLALLVLVAVPVLLARGVARAVAADELSAEEREDEPPVTAQERLEEARPAGAAQER
jgi:hypothetical protein